MFYFIKIGGHGRYGQGGPGHLIALYVLKLEMRQSAVDVLLVGVHEVQEESHPTQAPL